MVCSPLRTQIGSRASGNRPPICYLFKGVQTSESAQPIRFINVEKTLPKHGLARDARVHWIGEFASAPGVGGATSERDSGSRQQARTEARR